MQNKITHEFSLDGVPFKIEANEIGFHAQSAILVTYGETSAYITVTIGDANPELDFFPLTVDYVEKLYAGGIISSSPYIKREGKPTDHEILSGRLVDHAIRSLFDPKFRNETQIIVQIMSYDAEHDPVLASIIGVSFALSYSGLPFMGPYGATLVGLIDDKIVFNPTLSEMKKSSLEMIVSSVEQGIVSVEADAHDIPDEIVKDGIKQAVEHNKDLIEEQKKFIEKFGKKEFNFVPDVENDQPWKLLVDEIDGMVHADLEAAIYLKAKSDREGKLKEILKSTQEKFASRIESEEIRPMDVALAIEYINKKIVRRNIIENKKRPDGRKIDEIRPLSMRVGVLPRVHGSALFTRGETQSLTIVTLGTERDAQRFQNLEGDQDKYYFHHYNMPGYANGEIDRKFGMPNRRAIGHGAIGEKALKNVLPSMDEFPYTIRVVSEIMSSNGSTSMAATCASSLALMDAGVKIKKTIGGIGIGLVFDSENEYVILTDIIGMEDFYGDMDFKITGSKDGITAIQLDNKMSGIPVDLLLKAIDQSRTGRLFVIDQMEKCISEGREDVSINAPKVKVLRVKEDKIGELIGPGGKNIKNIIEQTGAEINIEDDGTVMIYAKNAESFAKAQAMVNGTVAEPEVGMEYDAEVVRVEDYGAFIEVPETKIQGMVHVSNFGMGRVDKVSDVVKVGQKVRVKFLGRDEKRRTKFAFVSDKNENTENVEKK